jgi:hypothetical protein
MFYGTGPSIFVVKFKALDLFFNWILFNNGVPFVYTDRFTLTSPCLAVCLYLPTCLSVCRNTCLPVCLLTNLFAFIPASLFSCLPARLPGRLSALVTASLPTCFSISLSPLATLEQMGPMWNLYTCCSISLMTTLLPRRYLPNTFLSAFSLLCHLYVQCQDGSKLQLLHKNDYR